LLQFWRRNPQACLSYRKLHPIDKWRWRWRWGRPWDFGFQTECEQPRTEKRGKRRKGMGVGSRKRTCENKSLSPKRSHESVTSGEEGPAPEELKYLVMEDVMMTREPTKVLEAKRRDTGTEGCEGGA
jgi:hypothetical protein